MPAKSEKQQVAARIAHAIKKGKVKPKKGTASAAMAKGMSDKQIKHFMVREQFAEPPGEPGVLSREAGPSPEAPSQAVKYRGHEIRVYRNSHKAFDAYINGKPRLTRNSPFEAIRDAKKIIDARPAPGVTGSRPGESIGEKAVSDKQRAFLNARFGHAWTKRHHYDTPGELPTYAHGGKTTSPEVKAAFNKRKKKKKTEETTTSVNIGSQGTATVPPRPKPRPQPSSPVLQKKKKTPPPVRAIRSYTGREMAVARDRVLQMVAEYEANRDRRRGVRPKPVEQEKIFGRDFQEILDMQQGKPTGRAIRAVPGKDYGADPIGDGTFRMVPSGDIVSKEERIRRLGH
jgi:hypothetical protein